MNWLLVIAAIGLGHVVWRGWAASKYRTNLTEAYAGCALVGDAPPATEAQDRLVRSLEGLGFERVTSQAMESGGNVIFLHRGGDSSIAEIALFGSVAPDWGAVVEITSGLGAQTAVLCTGAHATQSFNHAELRQTFLDADPAQLVANHEVAVAYVNSRGLTTTHLDPGETLDMRAAWFERDLALIKTATRAELLLWIRDARAGHPTSAGPIAENPVMVERLQAILDDR